MLTKAPVRHNVAPPSRIGVDTTFVRMTGVSEDDTRPRANQRPRRVIGFL